LKLGRDLHDDTFYIVAKGVYYEPTPQEGSILCPLCKRVWLTVTLDGWITTEFVGSFVGTGKSYRLAQGSRDDHVCAGHCNVGRMKLATRDLASPIELLRERVDAMLRGGTLQPRKEVEVAAKTVQDVSPTRRHSRDVLNFTAESAKVKGPAHRRKSSKSCKTLPTSARGNLARPWLSLESSTTSSEASPGALIRETTTEALVRRFEVERARRELGEEERQLRRERQEYLKHEAEQYKQHCVTVVAAERDQKTLIDAARKSIIEARTARGKETQLQSHAISEELEQRRLSYDIHQRRRVQETKSMQERAIQNVFEVARAGGIRALEAGRVAKQEQLVNEVAVDHARQARLEEKRERARTAREAMPDRLASSAALWAQDRVVAGQVLRAIASEGKMQREAEIQARREGALVFRDEVRSWRDSSRIVRAQIEEGRKQLAQTTREQRVVHEEVCHQIVQQAMLARKVSHDSVCLARQADEELVVEYQEFQHAIEAEAQSYTDKRAAAAKRATAARKRDRRQERGRMRGLLLQIAGRPPRVDSVPYAPLSLTHPPRPWPFSPPSREDRLAIRI
jgi:hypothetical protein